MTNELARLRALRRLSLAIGASLAAATAVTAAQAQDAPPPDVYTPTAAQQPPQEGQSEAQPASRRQQRPGRARTDIGAYLEVSQVLSADLGSGGDTLTYTSVAAGADGRIETRRVTAQMSLRYEHNFDWNDNGVDSDVVSGLAVVSAQIVPGALTLDAGALATRTGGDGRVFGVTNGEDAVDVYSAFVGPTLSTHAGPLAVNASYRLGYVKVDDHRAAGLLDGDFDDATAHSATASLGMAPGRGLPFGWTVGAGYARENSGGRFRNRFEGMYVRGDVVVPVGRSLALTAGVGYEDMEASQRDVVRDAGGVPVIGPGGTVTPDPNAPRLLTYNLSGVMYDGGVIWRPSPRTELQVRAGHRYGGTTVAGSFDHQVNEHQGIHAEIFDSVQTFGNLLTADLGRLPANFDANRDPLTGGLGGCVFGAQGGRCFDRSLAAISAQSFRMRGGSLVFSGERGLWSYGVGASYAHRRYHVPTVTGFASVATEDDVYSVYGTVGRQLSRSSEINFDAFASWYDSDVALDSVTTVGGTLSYNRSLLLEHLQVLAALGVYHSDNGVEESTNASALGGLRYSF